MVEARRAPWLACIALIALAPSVGAAQNVEPWWAAPGSRVEIDRRQNGKIQGTIVRVEGGEVAFLATEGDTVAVDLTTARSIQVEHSAPRWRADLGDGVAYFFVLETAETGLDPETAPERMLLVMGDSGLQAFDAASGTWLWRIPDIPKPKETDIRPLSHGGLALLWLDGGETRCFRIATGEEVWRQDEWPFRTFWSQFLVLDDQLVVGFGRTAEKRGMLMVVESATGVERWRRDDIFTIQPRDEDRVRSLVRVADSTLVIHASREGPIALSLRDGSTRWVGDVLAKEDVPYARSAVDGDVIFVAKKRGVVALDGTTGAPLWEQSAALRSDPVQMLATPAGLLVRGGDWKDGRPNKNPYLTLLDARTGHAVWDQEFRQLKNATRFQVREDSVYLAADDRFFRLDLATGVAHEVATAKFKGQEDPYRMHFSDDGVELVSSQNVMGLAPDGSLRYHRFYTLPIMSWGETFSDARQRCANPSSRVCESSAFGATPGSAEAFYSYTSDSTSEGIQGYSLVQVRWSDGVEVARIWMDAGYPRYVLDVPTGMVFWLDKNVIAALPWVPRTRTVPHVTDPTP